MSLAPFFLGDIIDCRRWQGGSELFFFSYHIVPSHKKSSGKASWCWWMLNVICRANGNVIWKRLRHQETIKWRRPVHYRYRKDLAYCRKKKLLDYCAIPSINIHFTRAWLWFKCPTTNSLRSQTKNHDSFARIFPRLTAFTDSSPILSLILQSSRWGRVSNLLVCASGCLQHSVLV